MDASWNYTTEISVLLHIVITWPKMNIYHGKTWAKGKHLCQKISDLHDFSKSSPHSHMETFNFCLLPTTQPSGSHFSGTSFLEFSHHPFLVLKTEFQTSRQSLWTFLSFEVLVLSCFQHLLNKLSLRSSVLHVLWVWKLQWSGKLTAEAKVFPAWGGVAEAHPVDILKWSEVLFLP